MKQRDLIMMPAILFGGPFSLLLGIYSAIRMTTATPNNQFYDLGWMVAYGLLIGGAVMIHTALGFMYLKIIRLHQMLEATSKELAS